MKIRYDGSHFLAAITVAGFAFTAPSAFAEDLTWDPVSGDGTTITAGSGTWDTSTTAWNNAGSDEAWTQTSAISGSNTATFAGADGTPDQYEVTLGEAVAAQSITFNNSGNKITGSTLALTNVAANGSITVAAGKTATINSILRYNHNVAASVTVNSGAVLNLGGGTTTTFNPQLNLSGGGTVNFTGGTFTSNIANVNVTTVNLTGGTYNYTPGNGAGPTIGSSAGKDVNFTVSGAGTLTCNNNAGSGTGTSCYLGVGATTGAFTSKLTVQAGGTVNIGTSKAGELWLARTADSNALLDMQGGSLTVGTALNTNTIQLFRSGANAGTSASITQSGGTITTRGLLFGGTTGTYDASALAKLQLTGGSFYVGAGGITRGSAATALPVAIQLQGGTLGASAAWSSSLDIKLGTATIQAANTGGTAQNITLSGILSDDSGAGTLTKTGAGSLTLSGVNEFTGATAVTQGTLVLGNADALSSSASLTVADGAALSLATTPSTVKNLTFSNTGTLNFNVEGGGTNLTVNDSNGVTNSGSAGSITINITGNVPANGTYTLISYSGSLQSSGFSAYKLGTFPAGKSYALVNAAGAVQLTVSDPSIWTGAQSSEWSTSIIPGSKNWTVSGSPADYVNGAAVIFDNSAPNKTVDISVADVTPASVQFNSTSTYTLQGSRSIIGAAPVTVTSGTTLKLGASNLLPNGSGSGNVTLDGMLDLNGFSETINGLSGAVSGGVDNLAGGTVTLTVGDGNGSGEIFGAIKNTAGSLGIVKVGSGQLFLRGSGSSFTGGVLVRNGTLNGGTSPNAIGTGGVTLGGSGSTGATFIGGQDFSPNVNVTVNPPDSGSCVIGANGTGSGMVIGSITLNNADVRVETFAGGTTATTTVKGGVTGTGNLLLNNLTTNTSSNRVIFSAASLVNHTGTITGQGTGTTSNFIGANIGANVTGVIQNSATALLVLDGINSYAGNTTVNAGILRINKADTEANANPNNDASTVTIASGALMNLQYTGTDIVGKLFFGPTQQPSGTYSSTSVPVGATITTASFLGGGTLTVTSGPGGFASWITGTFANGTVPSGKQGPDDDPDNDGIPNLLEYAIAGQDPTVPNPTIGSFDGTLLSFSKRAGTSGLIYAIEESTDLGIGDDWDEVGSYTQNDSSTISHTLTPGTPARNFLRLRVSQ